LRRHALGALAALGVATLGTGCGADCCAVDSLPIPVTRAPRGDGMSGGAVLARARLTDGATPSATFPMVIDTGSPVTVLAGPVAGGTLTPGSHSFELLDALAPDPNRAPVRARFRNIGLFTLPLGPVGDAATRPGGVFGGDLLRGFSLEFRFAGPCPAGATAPCSSITFWPHQGASNGFLGDAGYAVLRLNLFGGGETTAQTTPDTLGLRAPIDLPATRVVLRTCAAPRAFATTEPRELCCARGDEITSPRATGVDLSLVLATGAGPMVLSRKAWNRIRDQLPAAPAATCSPAAATCPELLLPSWPLPIGAEWFTIPRFAVVDGSEPPSTGDEGPCVDLGRSRRIEWTAIQQQAAQQAGAGEAACVQLCDTDPREGNLAQNSAAYLEVGGTIPVAVIEDAEPFLQSLRFDVRPEGPEVDGLVGAGAMGAARLELDYGSDPARAIFSCEPGATRDSCYAAPRCPRLPDHDQTHLCFGLPAHRLPATCAPSGC
jgi:hypothetical protein